MCDCSDDYFGKDCGTSHIQLELKQAARAQLIDGLNNLTKLEDPSPQVVESWTTSLSSLTSNPEELSLSAIEIASTLAETIISNAIEMNMPYTKTEGMLEALDSLASSSSQHTVSFKSRRLGRSVRSHSGNESGDEFDTLSTAVSGSGSGIGSGSGSGSIADGGNQGNQRLQQLTSVLTSYTSHVASQLVVGEDPLSVIKSNFRMTVTVGVGVADPSHDSSRSGLEGSYHEVIMAAPLSPFEKYLGHVPSSFTVPTGIGTGITADIRAIYMKKELFNNDTFNSDPLLLTFSRNLCSTDSTVSSAGSASSVGTNCTVKVILQNSAAVDYSRLNAAIPVANGRNENVSEVTQVICQQGVFSITNVSCSNGHNSSIVCNGTHPGVFTYVCPSSRAVATCRLSSKFTKNLYIHELKLL